jgi:hypothetical protein
VVRVWPRLSPVVTTVAAFCLGFFVAWLPLADRTVPIRETARYPVWVFLVALNFGLCPTIWRHGRKVLTKLGLPGHVHREVLGYAVGALAATAVLMAAGLLLASDRATREPLPYMAFRIGILYAVIAVAIAPAVIAIVRVGRRAGEDAVDPPDLVRWQGHLRAVLASLGGLVALGTVTTAALRNAILAVPGARPTDFPGERIVMFGAALTVLLAMIYVPNAAKLRDRAAEVVDQAAPVPEQLTGDGWQDRLTTRAELSSALGAEESATASIQSALVIGGPLIASALTLFLPGR